MKGITMSDEFNAITSEIGNVGEFPVHVDYQLTLKARMVGITSVEQALALAPTVQSVGNAMGLTTPEQASMSSVEFALDSGMLAPKGAVLALGEPQSDEEVCAWCGQVH